MINIIPYKKYVFKPGYFVSVSITNIFYFDFFYDLYMINILELLHNHFISSEGVDRPRKPLNKVFKTGSIDLPYPGTKPYTTLIFKILNYATTLLKGFLNKEEELEHYMP